MLLYKFAAVSASFLATLVMFTWRQFFQTWVCVSAVWVVVTMLQRRSRPPGPFPLPFIGNLLLFLTGDMSDHVRNLTEKYGEIVEFWIIDRRFVVVSNLDAVKTTIYYTLRSEMEPVSLQEIHMHNQGVVLNQDPHVWNYNKQMIVQGLNPSKARQQVIDYSWVCSEAFSKQLNMHALSDVPCNVYKVVLPFMLNSAFVSAFGEHLDPKFEEHFEQFFPAMCYFTFTPSFIWSNLTKSTTAKFRETMRNIVKTERHVMSGSKEGSELLKHMLLQQLNNPNLTNEQIRTVAHEFMLGAIDGATLSCNLFWFIYRNPDVLAKIREEVKRVKGEDVNAAWTVEQYDQLRYCEQVIYETIRVAPSNPFTGRMNGTDDVVGGYAFPKLTNFLVATELLAQSEKYWKDPQMFNPDRFDSKSPESVAKMNGIFIPFGGGGRACPGKRVGLILLKTVLVTVCPSYNISFHAKELKRVWEAVRAPVKGEDWVTVTKVDLCDEA